MVGLEQVAWLISSGVERNPGGIAPAGDVRPAVDLPRPDATALERKDVTAAGEPELRFSVQFPGDTDLLDYDAWIALDRAAAVLREQPEMFALIVYQSEQSLDRLTGRELARVRIATIERYLVTGGADPERLRVDNAVALGVDAAAEDVISAGDRFIQISIVSGAVE